MASHDQLMVAQVKTEVNEAEVKTEVNEAEVKTEVDVAEEDWRTLNQSGQDTMHDCAEVNTCDNHDTGTSDPLIAITMSRPIRKVYTCQWIKTEPVEENETSDVVHQFQSESVDKSERKGDIKRESLTSVGLSCEQMSSGTTGSIEQSQHTSSEVKFEPFPDSESSSSIDAEPVYFSDREIKVEFEDGSETDPGEASTSFPVNIRQPYINNSLQTEEVTDIKMTVTRMDEDMSSSNEQEYNEECRTIHQDPGSNKPATSVMTTPRPFVCDVCQKGFTTKCNLKMHKLIHTGQKSFVCDVCEKAFTLKGSLKTHKLTHTGQKSFVCDVCEKKFTHKSSLKSHMLIHTGQKSFICDVCEKAFTEKSSLRKHMLTHTEQKSFVCDVCEQAFKWKSSLTNHKLTHNGQKNEKSFVCDVCEKGFNKKGTLKRHKLTHTGQKSFVCDVCEKGFAQKCGLKRHQLIHTGQKSFVCDVCNVSFTLKSHLKTHELIHSDIKQFVCDVCNKSFKQRQGLINHNKAHHLSDTTQ